MSDLISENLNMIFKTPKGETVHALKDVSFTLKKGELLTVLGPSGCGKTTLLNCIAGLLDLSDGQIWIEDDNVTWKEPKDRHIGMVFQSYALYPSMTVEKNLSFGLRTVSYTHLTLPTKRIV